MSPTSCAHRTPVEQRLTDAPYGHVLTNVNCLLPDGDWIVYDTRSDPAGDRFDGIRIEAVNVHAPEVKVLYGSRNAPM